MTRRMMGFASLALRSTHPTGLLMPQNLFIYSWQLGPARALVQAGHRERRFESLQYLRGGAVV